MKLNEFFEKSQDVQVFNEPLEVIYGKPFYYFHIDNTDYFIPDQSLKAENIDVNGYETVDIKDILNIDLRYLPIEMEKHRPEYLVLLAEAKKIEKRIKNEEW